MMNVQNFMSFRRFSESAQKLETIENKQRVVLKRLRREYEKMLVNKEKRKLSSNVKLEKIKSIRGSYTFKLRPNDHHSKEHGDVRRKKRNDGNDQKMHDNDDVQKVNDEVHNKKKQRRDEKSRRTSLLKRRVRSAEFTTRKSMTVTPERPQTSPSEKLKEKLKEKLQQRKTIHSMYTFKLPVNPVHMRTSSDDHSLKQKLSRDHSKMIEAGNLYSIRNRGVPIFRTTVNEKTSRDFRLERLQYGRKMGNRFSMKYRHESSFDPHKPKWQLHSERKSYKQLVARKDRMEWTHRNSIKFNRTLPDEFVADYVEVLDKICYYESTFDFRESGVEESEWILGGGN
jgi:hypothetical protein